jgi:hypothetical protein
MFDSIFSQLHSLAESQVLSLPVKSPLALVYDILNVLARIVGLVFGGFTSNTTTTGISGISSL